MKVMKANKILLGMFAALAMTGCKDSFLEVTSPTDTFIDEYYTTKTSLDEALVAAYAPLHWYDYGSTYQYNALNFISEFMSDDMYPNGSSNTDQPMLQLMFNYSCTPVVCLTGVWSDSFSGVKRSNDVLTYCDWVEKAGNITAAQRADYEAQARLLRVFYYLQLWKFYGNIPCYFENLAAPYISEQLTADEVYAKVIEELESVIATGALKDDYPAEEKGHVTKPLAYMIYAEMVMIQNDSSRYGKALSYMKELISSGKYQLTPNYKDIWDESGEWNAESIWEINYFDDNSVRGWNNQLAAGGAVFPRLHGPRSFKANAGDPYEDVDAGWGFSAIPLHSVASFEEGDIRKEFSAFDMFAHGTSDDPGWMNTGYCLYKYMCRKGNNKDQKADADLGFNNNLRVYRYSEVLLNAAELLVKTGGSVSDAANYVNEVRARAGLPAVNGVDEDVILNERRHEFMGEGKRYFDLVRTGKAASVLTPANDSGHFRTKAWSEDVRYLPIPQDNIDAAQGTLKQNGNY